MDKIKDLRKSLNILREMEDPKGVFNEAVFIEDGPLDVDPMSTGPETRVEVSFKDGDNIEVEVYAQGNEELKRLMDLAGIFHKDKQSGMIAPPPGTDMAPDAMSVEPAPTMDLGAQDIVDPDTMGMEPDPMADPMADMGAPDELDPGAMMAPMDNEPVGAGPVVGDDGMDSMGSPMDMPGVDVPTDTPADMDDEMGDEMDFEIPVTDDIDVFEKELEEGENVIAGKKHDYGFPNPNLGQEPYELKAHDFVGGAGKPVRFVPARSGDNAMVDISHSRKGRGLKEYIADVEAQKKNLNELIDPETETKLLKIQQAYDDHTTNVVVRRTIDNKIDDMVKDPQLSQMTSRDMSADLDDELSKRGTRLSEPEADKLDDEIDAFDEAKRRYSFKQNILPFQGLSGVQRMKRNAAKAASRSIKRR